MVTFPFCKINLGLRVLSKRNDGYHDIETCFFPVPWTDILEIIPAAVLEFSLSGIPVAGDYEANSCMAAWRMLSADHKIPPVKMHLHKVVPTEAGLGGGSSDGAFALRSLNDLFEIGLSKRQLTQYAARIGSDCAYFLERAPMIGTGRGEILHPAQVNLHGKFLVIVKPDIHVSTAAAYRDIIPKTAANGLNKILELPFEKWKDTLVNDFEQTVFEKHPAIAQVKEKLYSLGAGYASMSGSGAAVFGIFEEQIGFEKNGDLFFGMQTFSCTM